jgi:hypothetical protein
MFCFPMNVERKSHVRFFSGLRCPQFVPDRYVPLYGASLDRCIPLTIHPVLRGGGGEGVGVVYVTMR